ncbi:MAG: hypothetical protein HYR64_06105 [Fimbriimonas ginsengisoli]|uniref:Teneurin-like YD-shell domain-containing protein n=1 Tax=Fimbriimonas ginsengisoli TaxID=1005039 RepID=A0A931LSS7_FIMGI|nr:hypothetical protein [Fimbriimonas ginsengisoli]
MGGATTLYGYDAIDQITSESASGYAATYTYDANGNRTGKTLGGVTDTYTLDSGDKLTSTSTKSYTYDAAGRTTAVTSGGQTTTVAYDYEDRITSITYPSTATNTFTYNGLDTRVGKVDSAGTKTYKRDGAGVTDPVLADGAANYTPGASERRGGSSGYYHQDRMGSIVRVTDSVQSTASVRQFDSFGQVVASSGSSASPFGFAGGEGYQTDSDSGLTLLGHRYYDTSTGRFLTRDDEKDGRNWYAYVDSNPNSSVDPEGRDIVYKHYSKRMLSKVKRIIKRIRKTAIGNHLLVGWEDHAKTLVIQWSSGTNDNAFTDMSQLPNKATIDFDPETELKLNGKGNHHSNIKMPPDVVLAHELGHAHGKLDPGGGEEGAAAGPGDNVWDVENKYRQERSKHHLAPRLYY